MPTVYCSSCGAPYSASRGKCPNCDTVEPEVGSELTNTLAPPADTGEPDDAALVKRFGREEGAAMERDCPQCAERIKVKAKKCRFCGYDLALEDGDEDDDRSRGRGLKRGSSGRHAARRRSDPNACPCGGVRVERVPVWAIVCLILFFPLGLVFLLVKERRCVRCGN
ncbi:hypothetical protein HY251_22240 [bacterium]|nr:hypothetical protein [bacterium]